MEQPSDPMSTGPPFEPAWRHFTGSIQGGTQAACFALGMFLGMLVRGFPFGSGRATLPFVVALALGSGGACALGLWIDHRRYRTSTIVRLQAAPRRIRLAAWSVVTAPVVMGVIAAAWSSLRMLVCVAPFAAILLILGGVTADRIVSAVWVLRVGVREDRRRREWRPLTVLDVHEDATAHVRLDDDGERLTVWSDVALERGEDGYAALDDAITGEAAYRHTARRRLVAFETALERDARRLGTRTAITALVAALGWLAVWASPLLGLALARYVPGSFAPR